MNNGADAADQVVNMSLRGIELIAKITGAGAKNLATYLYAVLKDQKKTKGKTRLAGLLRSGKELKVFAVRNEDLARFTQEAKRYGVLYCALRDKKNLDGVCDIMVRAEDASKINRIVERFKLATVDTASIKSEILKSRESKQEPSAPAEKKKSTRTVTDTDAFVSERVAHHDNPKPGDTRTIPANPTKAGTERSSPSAPIFEHNEHSKGETAEPEKKSVRKELQNIRQTRLQKETNERNPLDAQQTVGQPGRPTVQSTKNHAKAR
jgi:hypothetical protein